MLRLLQKLSISYETDKLSEIVFALGKKYRQVLRTWFNLGTFISLILSILCCIFLLFHICYYVVKVWVYMTSFQTLPKDGERESSPIQSAGISLVMLVPGLNIPFGDILYLIIALFICAVVHEFGHAIAAAADEIKLETVGFNLFLIFPSAYVILPSSDLNRSSLISRLRIFCAGAWHNIVLCIFVITFIFLFCSPSCPTSLFETNGDSGIFVLRVDEASPLKDRLQSRSVSIVGVGDCPTPNREAWIKCLTELMQKPHGYCVPKDLLMHSHKENGEECCTKMHNRRLCFDVVDSHFSKEHNELKKVCLIARDVTKYETCINNCKLESHVCVKPFQQVQDETKNVQNIEHLLRIKLSKEDEIEQDRDIIYFGTILSLYHQVEVSNFRIRWPFNIVISFNTLSLLEKLCRYIFALSSALALLNLAPVYMLDGEKVYETIFLFLSFRYRHSISPYLFRTIYNYICTIFSALLVLNLAISMLNMLQMVL